MRALDLGERLRPQRPVVSELGLVGLLVDIAPLEALPEALDTAVDLVEADARRRPPRPLAEGDDDLRLVFDPDHETTRPFAQYVVADAATPVLAPTAALVVVPAAQVVAVHPAAAVHAPQEALERILALGPVLVPASASPMVPAEVALDRIPCRAVDEGGPLCRDLVALALRAALRVGDGDVCAVREQLCDRVRAPTGREARQTHTFEVQAAGQLARTDVPARVVGEDASDDRGDRLVDRHLPVLVAGVPGGHGADHEALRRLMPPRGLDLLAGHPSLEFMRRGESCVSEPADRRAVEAALHEHDVNFRMLVKEPVELQRVAGVAERPRLVVGRHDVHFAPPHAFEEGEERLAALQFPARDVEVLQHLDAVALRDSGQRDARFALDLGRNSALVILVARLANVNDGDRSVFFCLHGSQPSSVSLPTLRCTTNRYIMATLT